MAGGGGSEVVMPRSFKILDELEEEKGGKSPPGISIGLSKGDDETLSEFNGSIVVMSGGSPLQGRFLTLRIVPGDDYPRVPPKVVFISKVNVPGVKSNGEVDPSKFGSLSGWSPDSCMVNVLADIQRACSTVRTPQPPEDATFSS